MKQKGFTLIELLVVIAIIGILASVVLASLNSARNKGADAAIKSGLANARAQAEIFYDSYASPAQTYTGVCAVAANTINTIIQGAATAGGSGTVLINSAYDAGPPKTANCNNNATAWAASVPLKTSGFWCVDSTGKSASTTQLVAGTDVACP